MSRKQRFQKRESNNLVSFNNYVEKTRDIVITPRNRNQEKYLDLLENDNNYIVIASGPAGTGKTLIACQHALKLFKNKQIEKIIITRPAVAADEKLGYLPGTLEQKMDPWVRPIFDVFEQYYSKKTVQEFIENGQIEISPLAFMRGRTFKNAFIIGDEMQNATPSQVKMLMTRIGDNSRIVITGDVNQTDRPGDKNGLVDFMSRYNFNCPGIASIKFTKNDVERHPIIETILHIYGEE
jgi:phosphate starvation-inducible PhoH-like protein